jgi:DNA mismatch repair protein MutH
MSVELAEEVRKSIYPQEVICGNRLPTLSERNRLLEECTKQSVSLISIGNLVGKPPSSPKDKNWRGRALEVYVGGNNNSIADRDFEDGELKSTRVEIKKEKWSIEQVLRITTLEHANSSHLKNYEETPFFRKISCFTCALIDSQKSNIESGKIVGSFTFNIQDEKEFYREIMEDYIFYSDKIRESHRVSNKVKSPNGFLICRQTAGEAGVISKTSLYITKKKFNSLLDFYGINA